MDSFSDLLGRLKLELRVSKDGEVAVALGMTKTAFAERKRRGSFPEKELRAMAAERPEIDVGYVLTGERGSYQGRGQSVPISTILRSVMKRCGLKQQQFADILEVPLYRVKSLTTGRVQKLSQEEGDAMVKKLNVRAGYLFDGQEPMFQVVDSAKEVIQGFTKQEAMALVLDSMHKTGRTLPAVRVFAVIDAVMAWQRAGIIVTESSVIDQLRLIE